MRLATYARYELVRTFRNRRFVILSLGFPLVLYYVIAAPNRHVASLASTGISAPTYYMVGLAAFGTMNSMLALGARIASERAVGWNRQLRITPLTTRAYFRAKIGTSYLTALLTLAVLYLAGVSLGVSLPAHAWVRMTVLMLVGLVPFAGLGVLIGHLFSPDSIGPVMGGATAIFALLGGTWFPITSGVMHRVAEALPSFWLVQASHTALGAHGWSATGWLVVGAWSVAAALLAGRAYRRDTRRA